MTTQDDLVMLIFCVCSCIVFWGFGIAMSIKAMRIAKNERAIDHIHKRVTKLEGWQDRVRK